MTETLLDGDCVLLSKYDYGYNAYSIPFFSFFRPKYSPQTKIWGKSKPQRGDVVIFYDPKTENYYIKRVLGLPGDKIQFINGNLHINSIIAPKIQLGTYISHKNQGNVTKEIEYIKYHESLPNNVHYNVLHVKDPNKFVSVPRNTEQYSIPLNSDKYFLVGDNRDRSNDSRQFGFISGSYIIGKVHYPLFSVQEELLLKGSQFTFKAQLIQIWNFIRSISFVRFLRPISYN